MYSKFEAKFNQVEQYRITHRKQLIESTYAFCINGLKPHCTVIKSIASPFDERVVYSVTQRQSMTTIAIGRLFRPEMDIYMAPTNELIKKFMADHNAPDIAHIQRSTKLADFENDVKSVFSNMKSEYVRVFLDGYAGFSDVINKLIPVIDKVAKASGTVVVYIVT